jgi:hypothetical protein
MAGVRVTADQAQAKWVSRLQGATTEITNGVNNVTVAPGQLAAAQSQKWLQNVQAAAEKWKRNVGAVSLEQWRMYMLNVGVPRISQGANAKQAKYGAFAQQFFPHLEAGIQKVRGMPSTTLDDNIQRAVAMMRHNASFKRSGA